MSKYFSLAKGKEKKVYSGKKSEFERHVELLKKMSPDGKILMTPNYLEVSEHSWCMQVPYSFGEFGYVEASDLLKTAKLINGQAFSVTIVAGNETSAVFQWEGNQTELKIERCGPDAGIPVYPNEDPELMHLDGSVLAPLLYSASGGIPDKDKKCLKDTFRRVYLGGDVCFSTDGIIASICPIEVDQLNRCSFSFSTETVRALRKIDFPLMRMTFEQQALVFYFEGINFFVSVDGDKVFDRSLGMPDIGRLQHLEDEFHPAINVPKAFWKHVKNFKKSKFLKLRNEALEDDSGTIVAVDIEPFQHSGCEICFDPETFLRLETLVCSGSQWEFSDKRIRITDACGDVIYFCGMKVA